MNSLTNLIQAYSLGLSIRTGLFKENLTQNKMDTCDEIMSRLKFIGRIDENVKVNVKHTPYLQPDGIATRISRTFFDPDSRSGTLNFVTNTIKAAFELLTLHLNSKRSLDRIACSNIVTDLKNSITGLVCLKKTYSTDVFFCARLDTLIQEINARMTEIEISYPEILRKNSPPEMFRNEQLPHIPPPIKLDEKDEK